VNESLKNRCVWCSNCCLNCIVL